MSGSQLVRVILSLAGMLGGAVAYGQSATLEIEPSTEPLSCLMSIRPKHKLPDYPTDAAPGASAVVRVKLKFVANDTAPEAQVVFNNAAEAFARAVREHVASYRLPCLNAGQSFTGIQEFQFVATSPLPAVIESATRNDDQETTMPEGCLASAVLPRPDFPRQAFGAVEGGVVVARFKFFAGDQPPEATIVFDGGQRRLSQAVLRRGE